MASKGKIGVAALVIFLTAGHLPGFKARGKLLVPGANGEKRYRGVITINRAEIGIECDKKIFQPLNEFDIPKQSKIKVKTGEVQRIAIQGNEIVIFPRDKLCKRYRNLLTHVWLLAIMSQQERLVFIFKMDKPSIGFWEEELIAIINEKNDPEGRMAGIVRTY